MIQYRVVFPLASNDDNSVNEFGIAIVPDSIGIIGLQWHSPLQQTWESSLDALIAATEVLESKTSGTLCPCGFGCSLLCTSHTD